MDVALMSRTEQMSSEIDERPHEKQSESHEGCRPVILPLRAPARPQLPAMAVVEAWKPTILVVDDSPMNRKMLVRMLISNGFACREAEDGMEALSEISRMYSLRSDSDDDALSLLSPAIATSRTTPVRFSLKRLGSLRLHQEREEQEHEKRFAIDAVLIDSNMPRMNGPEAIVEMRKIGFRGPIIGVSGGDEITMKQFFDAGADNVMQKPAQSDKLVTMVLIGLELVVQEATSRQLRQSSVDGSMRSSMNAWNEHINRLRRFIEAANAAGKK